jgi:hypothetical protein
MPGFKRLVVNPRHTVQQKSADRVSHCVFMNSKSRNFISAASSTAQPSPLNSLDAEKSAVCACPGPVRLQLR